MNCAKVGSLRISVLTLLVATALFADGASGQFRYQSDWLLPQEERKAILVDEYTNIRLNDEKHRLDSLGIALQQDPSAKGHIIYYGGSICHPGETSARAGRAADYLISTRGIDAERIIKRDGGYREEVGAELYVVPLGVSEPPASPTISRCTEPAPTPRKRIRRKSG
jgi:hypothetical protein